MRESILFVINPIAGGKDKQDTVAIIKGWAKHTNKNLRIYKTTGNNDLSAIKSLIKEEKPDKVVSVGGDGTLLMCAKVLQEYDIPLGIIPLGSANGMSMELKIPNGIEAQLNLLSDGLIKEIDLIDFNGGNDVGMHISDIGLNARLVKHFEESERRGFLGYAQGVWQEYVSPEKFHVEIKTEDQYVHTDVLMLAIANARWYGSGAYLNKIGKLDDGLMEICLVKRLDFSDFVEHWFELIDDDFQHLEVLQCREAEIKLRNKEEFQIDGELKQPVDTLKIKLLPKALKLIVPK